MNADEAKSVGALLRKIRIKRGLSQEVVAGLAGFSVELPAPGNGHTDSAIEAVREALNAAQVGYPGGELLPVPVLAAGRDLGILLPLGVLLHVQVTRDWLGYAVAHIDVRLQAMFLARDLA